MVNRIDPSLLSDTGSSTDTQKAAELTTRLLRALVGRVGAEFIRTHQALFLGEDGIIPRVVRDKLGGEGTAERVIDEDALVSEAIDLLQEQLSQMRHSALQYAATAQRLSTTVHSVRTAFGLPNEDLGLVTT